MVLLGLTSEMGEGPGDDTRPLSRNAALELLVFPVFSGEATFRRPFLTPFGRRRSLDRRKRRSKVGVAE